MKIWHPLDASLLSAISILARRVAFPLLFLGAGLVLVPPCASQTWTATGSLATARNGPTATLLPNGKVLAAAGAGGASGRLTSAELYDPASGTWTATGSLATGRVEHTETLLPNGKVLVAGGLVINFNALASGAVYGRASGTSSAWGSVSVCDGDTAWSLLLYWVVVAG